MSEKQDLYLAYKAYQESIGLQYNKQESRYHIAVPRNQVADTKYEIRSAVETRQYYSEKYCNNQMDYGHQKQIDALNETQIHPQNNNGTYDMRFASNQQFRK